MLYLCMYNMFRLELLGCDFHPRVADLSQADRKLLVKGSRTSAPWHEFLKMVLQIRKCFKVFPNMWGTTKHQQQMHKKPSSPPRRGFLSGCLFRYLQMCQHYAARWVQLHEVMRRSHALYPGGGVGGCQDWNGGRSEIGRNVSHIKIDLTPFMFIFWKFGNWQFWMASTVDDKHEPKSQDWLALVLFYQLRWTFRLSLPVDPVGLLLANEPKEHIRLVVQVESYSVVTWWLKGPVETVEACSLYISILGAGRYEKEQHTDFKLEPQMMNGLLMMALSICRTKEWSRSTVWCHWDDASWVHMLIEAEDYNPRHAF